MHVAVKRNKRRTHTRYSTVFIQLKLFSHNLQLAHGANGRGSKQKLAS